VASFCLFRMEGTIQKNTSAILTFKEYLELKK
jgi:hypothetical protein